MKAKLIILTFLFSSGSVLSHAQSSARVIRKGNEFYKNKQYQEAQKEFNKVNDNDSLNEIAKFNLGNTLYRLGEKDEAIKTFDRLSIATKDSRFLSKLSYNEGVVFSNEQKLEKSITAYEKSLLLNPNDEQARENLQKALLELKKKNTPPENKQQQKQPPPKMNPKDAAQKLKQLEQKEKQVQQRVQKEKSAGAGSRAKDW